MGLGNRSSPPFLKPAAFDDHRTVTLLTIMCTSQAQSVIGYPAFVCQKESQFLLSAFAHSGHRSPPSALGRFTGRFWRFPALYAAEFLGMVSQPYPFTKTPHTAANGAHPVRTVRSAV